MDRAGYRSLVLAALCLMVAAPLASAQGPTSGVINGIVSDSSGAALPGVTVTATSPALMGAQVTVTNDRGQYRYPSLSPGEYTVVFELSGFKRFVREGIRVSIGFTAEVNIQLQLASLQESVTVTGASPVVDTQNTNVQNNFTSDMMKSLPNARDIWSLMAEAPGMTVTRFDVGGSTAGTQTGFSAYGQSTSNRVQIDGVNTTEGTQAAGFYMDYGAFEEIQLGVDSNDASMPVPGVFVNTLLKSGGNQFRGEMYVDYENEDLQGTNVDDRLQRLGVGRGTRMKKYLDANGNFGGPVKKDKFWFFASVRAEDIITTVTGYPVDNPTTDFGFETQLQNATYKVTYQLTPDNKLSHYIQYGRKFQPNRNAGSTYYSDAVYYQDSGTTVGNIEWNSIVSPSFFMTARGSRFGYNWPNYPYGNTGVIGQSTGRINEAVDFRRSENVRDNVAGGYAAYRYDRRRWAGEWTGTLYKDDLAGGNHAIKLGWLSEWEQFEDEEFGPRDYMQLIYQSTTGQPDFTTPYRITIYNRPFTSKDEQRHHGAFVSDQVRFPHGITANLGLRWDYYDTGYPDQEIRGGPWTAFFYQGQALPNGYAFQTTQWADLKVPAQWGVVKYPHAIAPRLGIAWDIRGDGLTVLKGNWGRYFNNPGTQSDNVNPVQSTSATFDWNDSPERGGNGDRLFQVNEFGTFRSGGPPGSLSTRFDPNIGHPYTDDVSVAIERQLLPNLGVRAAYVYRMARNGYVNIEQVRVGSLYTVQKTVLDPGIDGLAGTADDRGDFTFWDTPARWPGPSFTLRSTTPENYSNFKNIDVTVNKRMSQRWSLVGNFLHTWTFAHTLDQTPNGPLNNPTDTTLWAMKLFGTYQAPWGIVMTPQVLVQAGANLSRTLAGVSTTNGSATFTLEKTGSYRQDTIKLAALRTEKRIRFANRREVSAFIDIANLFNSAAAQNQDNQTGRRQVTLESGERVDYQRFMRPTTLVAPRVFRIGLRLAF